MPIYEYECRDCGERLTRTVAIRLRPTRPGTGRDMLDRQMLRGPALFGTLVDSSTRLASPDSMGLLPLLRTRLLTRRWTKPTPAWTITTKSTHPLQKENLWNSDLQWGPPRRMHGPCRTLEH